VGLAGTRRLRPAEAWQPLQAAPAGETGACRARQAASRLVQRPTRARTSGARLHQLGMASVGAPALQQDRQRRRRAAVLAQGRRAATCPRCLGGRGPAGRRWRQHAGPGAHWHTVAVSHDASQRCTRLAQRYRLRCHKADQLYCAMLGWNARALVAMRQGTTRTCLAQRRQWWARAGPLRGQVSSGPPIWQPACSGWRQARRGAAGRLPADSAAAC